MPYRAPCYSSPTSLRTAGCSTINCLMNVQSRPSRLEPLPQLTLTLPIRFQGDRLKICQLDRIMSRKRPRQEEDVFLDVRGQAGQVHDLADACPADLTQSGQRGQVRNH